MIDRYKMRVVFGEEDYEVDNDLHSKGDWIKHEDHQKTLDKIRTIIENADSYGGIGDIKSYILGVINE